MSVDLPTLGLPKTATAIPLTSGIMSSVAAGRRGIVFSMRSGIP